MSLSVMRRLSLLLTTALLGVSYNVVVNAQHATVDDSPAESQSVSAVKGEKVKVETSDGEGSSGSSSGSSGSSSSGSSGGSWWNSYNRILLWYMPISMFYMAYNAVYYLGKKRLTDMAKDIFPVFRDAHCTLDNIGKPYFTHGKITQIDQNLYALRFLGDPTLEDGVDAASELATGAQFQRSLANAKKFSSIDLVALLRRRHEIGYWMYTHLTAPERDTLRLEIELRDGLEPYSLAIFRKEDTSYHKNAHKDLQKSAKMKRKLLEESFPKETEEYGLKDKFLVFTDSQDAVEAMFKAEPTASNSQLGKNVLREILVNGKDVIDKIHVTSKYVAREYVGWAVENPPPPCARVVFDLKLSGLPGGIAFDAEKEGTLAAFEILMPLFLKFAQLCGQVKMAPKQKKVQEALYEELFPAIEEKADGKTDASDAGSAGGNGSMSGVRTTAAGKSKQKEWAEAAQERKLQKEKEEREKLDRITDPEKRRKAEQKFRDAEYKKQMQSMMKGGKKMTTKR